MKGPTEIGVFDDKVEELTSAGFRLEGEYFIYTRTRGPVDPSIVRGRPRWLFAVSSRTSLPLGVAFCRVFAHDKHQCQAVISVSSFVAVEGPEKQFTLPKGKHAQLQVQIHSRNEIWQYTTHSGSSLIGWLWRRPRFLFTYCEKMPCDVLLETHLMRRSEIARAGNFRWGKPPTLHESAEEEKAFGTYVREWSQQHSPIQLVFYLWRLKRKAPSEWLGELKDKL